MTRSFNPSPAPKLITGTFAPKGFVNSAGFQCQRIPGLPEAFVRNRGNFFPGADRERRPVEEFFGKVPRFHRLGELVGYLRFSEQNLNIHCSPAYSLV